MTKILLRGAYEEVVDYHSFDFSGGEVQVRLDQNISSPREIVIDADLRNSRDIIELFLITNALRHRYPGVDVHLLCKYLPYARQDRVCAPGEAYSLQVMCDLLKAQRYASITVWDVHSQKAIDLLTDRERPVLNGLGVTKRPVNNVSVVDLIPPGIIGDAVLLSPDKGAVARVAVCALRFKRPMILAEKIRETDTGKILETKVHTEGVDIGGADIMMIDDICDGGRTFIEIAKVLRPLTTGKINLWVTHLIASQGFGVFVGLIDDIYTANSFHDVVPPWVHVSQGCK